jgi:flagellar biosynthesis protein FliR
MTLTSAEITAWVGQWFWPFMRISALFVAAPIFAQRTMNRRVRVLLAATIAVMILPLLPVSPPIDAISPQGMLVLLQQLLIGTLVGFTLSLAVNAVMVAGEKMSMGMGFGFATMIDPQNGISVPVVSQFYQLLCLVLFLGMGGHLTMIAMLVDSFNTFPVGDLSFGTTQISEMLRFSGTVWVVGMLMSLPVVMGTLLINLAMGVMSRAAPQLNLMSVGFPFTIGVGFLLMLFLMPSSVHVIEKVWSDTFRVVEKMIGG